MRALLSLALLPALLCSGCLRQTTYHCATDEQCGQNGICELVGYCSLLDFDCPSSRRFGGEAGPYANQCVVRSGGDGGIDAPAGDGPMVGCPADFVLLTGAPPGSHVYKKLPVSQSWITQHDACSALSSNAYLAVPDDATELTGIAGISQAATFWVGLDDRVAEGTFVRSNGGVATFLPWAAGEPDNLNNEDCVNATSTTISDDDCTHIFPAVCECVP